MKFDFSFWNYSGAAKWNYSAEETVSTWKELGITIGFSFKSSGSSDDKIKMNQLILECEKQGLKLIVYDERIFWTTCEAEKTYLENVQQVVSDFGANKAVVGFYIGDEPNSTQFEAFKRCYKLFKRKCDKLGFMNFCFNDSLSNAFNGRQNYQKFLIDYAKETGLELMSNDRYSMLHITEFETGFLETGIDKYFADLNMFKRVAMENNIDYWVSLLSVGHWMYKTPSRSDIRWQISTAAAHGANAAQWFFVYQHRFADDYYEYPIELNGSKTQLFYDIKNETFQFNNKVVSKLSGFEFDKVFHITKSYGGTELLKSDSDCSLYVHSDHGYNGILTRFKNAENQEKFMITNNSQLSSELFWIEFKNDPKKNYYIWLPSGGTHIVEGKEFV